MILEFDMGNTLTKWRLREGQELVGRGSFKTSAWQEELSQIWRRSPELEGKFTIKKIQAASVLAGEINNQFAQACQKKFNCTVSFARSEFYTAGVTSGYQEPESLGVDRWLAVVAAYNEIKSACIVVDCGTAITIDLVDERGRHLGGYILPGFKLMTSSLVGGTQKISIEQNPLVVDLAPGKTTEGAINSAQQLMIKTLLDELLARQPSPYFLTLPSLFVCGGDAAIVLAHFESALYRPDLIFDGLALQI